MCGAQDSDLDELITDETGNRMFLCSDTEYCVRRRAAGHVGERLTVMKDRHVVELGLTDQVLDDPQHAYEQLLVSSVLQV